MINKINGLLGICSKAGKAQAGTDLVLEEMTKKKIYLVIVAKDASEKTIKNIKYYCNKENVELVTYGTISNNSKAIGKYNKAIIGISDKNLANAILKLIHGGIESEKNKNS